MQAGTTKDQGLYNKPSAAVHPGASAAVPYHNGISQRIPAHHKQCGVLQAELTVCFMSQSVSICLRLHSLAVCDCCYMPGVFVMITFPWPQYI